MKGVPYSSPGTSMLILAVEEPVPLWPAFFLAAVAAGVAVLIWLTWNSGRRACPTCGLRNTVEFTGHAPEHREKRYILVTRSASYVGGNRHGTTHGGTFYDERVPGFLVTGGYCFRCRNCEHEWVEETTREEEDFGRE
jgi:hypothetical protein